MRSITLVLLLASPNIYGQCWAGIGVEAQQEYLRCLQQQQQLDRIERNTRQSGSLSSARQGGELLGEYFFERGAQNSPAMQNWLWMDEQVRQPGYKDQKVQEWIECVDRNATRGAEGALFACPAEWVEACAAIVSNAYLGQTALAARDSMFARCLMPEQWVASVTERLARGRD